MDLTNLLSFEKYQAAGNHFMMIDARNLSQQLFDSQIIQKYCDPHFGVGANGLILIKNKLGFDFEMLYFNPDGSAAFCGNGARCAVLFAKKLKIIDKTAYFSAIDGSHYASIDGNQAQISMQNVELIQLIASNLYFLNTGAPHAVIWVDDVEKVDVVREAKKIRHDTRFAPAGVNVNFASIQNDLIFVRTFERGVEDETLSCGTGVTAVAILAFYLKKTFKNTIHVKTFGGILQVDFSFLGVQNFSDITLKGPVQSIFSGVIPI